MKCEDVQKAIWSSLLTPDDNAHIQTCQSCQGEHALMDKIVRDLSSLDTPQPSRSLKPSRDVIEKAVRSNKRLPFIRWTSIAASVAMVITAGTLIAQQLSTPSTDLTPAHPNQPVPQEPVQPPTTDPVTEKETTPEKNTPDLEIDVKFDSTADNIEMIDALKEYIQSKAKADLVDRIELQHLSNVIKPGDNRVVADLNYLIVGQEGKEKQTDPLFPVSYSAVTSVVQFKRSEDGTLAVETFADHWRTDDQATIINYWAQSLVDQNAVLQWATLLPERQQQTKQGYRDNNWTLISYSGKVVKSWEILGIDSKVPYSEPEYDVKLWYDDAKKDGEVARVQLFQEGGYWWIRGFQSEHNQTPYVPKTSTREEGVQFDAKTAKVGDKVGSMTLSELEVSTQGDIYSVNAAFSGKMTITGRYQYFFKVSEYIGDTVFFYPDTASTKKFPLLLGDQRGGLQIQFRNHELARKMFGPEGSSGAATVEIENYTINHSPNDVWDQATLLTVISKQE